MDRTISLWLPDAASGGVWMNSVRVWGVPGNVLGGNVYGFYSLAVPKDGQHVYGHGYTGAVHRWDFSTPLTDPAITAASPPRAIPRQTIAAGHVGPVTAVSWSRAPGCPPFLLSASDDKIAKVFTQSSDGSSWFELARPLVHGHSINGARFVGQSNTFAVTSSEKAVRLLDAPSTFLHSLFILNKREMSEAQRADADHRPLGAVLPPLSLSNRPIFEGASVTTAEIEASPVAPVAATDDEEGDGGESTADAPSTPTILSAPPLEDHLTHNTLWPEVRKLYAHAAEASCIATTHAGDTIVSGCTALRPGEATVCVWRPQVQVTTPIALLRGHRGTICTVAVSPGGDAVASTSIDMSLIIWAAPSWRMAVRLERAFKCPPLSCDWSPSHDILAVAGAEPCGVSLFRVGSDDRSVCAPCGTIPVAALCTAVSWAPVIPLTLAVGDQLGAIQIWSVSEPALTSTLACTLLLAFPPHLNHTAAIRSLDWSPPPTTGDTKASLLASGGNDNFLKIVRVVLP
jgi:WD40 repeat protein